jgi:hypothetical protein
MAFFADEFAVSNSATKLSTHLGLTDSATKHWKQITLRLNPGALNDAYFGGSGLTAVDNRGGILRATDTMPTVLMVTDSHIHIDDIYIIGTVNAANFIVATLTR